MISDAQLQSLGRYALFALVGAAIAAGLKLGTDLPGDAPIPWRDIASVFFLTLCGTLSTAVGTATLARPGSEGISTQVDNLRSEGVHRADMVVVRKDQARVALAGDGSVEAALTQSQTQQVADELERRMKAERRLTAEPADQDDERRAEGRG